LFIDIASVLFDAARQAAAAGPLGSCIGGGGPGFEALYLVGLGILAPIWPFGVQSRIHIWRNVDTRACAWTSPNCCRRGSTPMSCPGCRRGGRVRRGGAGAAL